MAAMSVLIPRSQIGGEAKPTGSSRVIQLVWGVMDRKAGL